ncbi:unnamed protein product [Brassica oleracea]
MDAFERKYRSHGVAVTSEEEEFEEPVENIGGKLAKQAAAKTSDLAGHGVVLAQGFIDDCVKVVAGGANPVLISKGSNAGRNDPEAESMIAEAMSKVGKKGVVVIDEGKTAENKVYVVEGMQFEPGYMSPYFITDHEGMCVEYDNCKLLLVDHKITNEREVVEFMEDVTRGGDPIIIIAEDIEQEPLDTLIVNKSKEKWNVAAVKAPGSGEIKSQYLDDIAIITGATVIREEDGLTLDKAGKEVLGSAYKVVLTKEMTTIVGDGTTHEAVNKRVAEIKNLLEQAEQGYEKETMNERLAKLSGGVAVIQVGGQTETERREKKLKFEAALNGAKCSDVYSFGVVLLELLTGKSPTSPETKHGENMDLVGADSVKKGPSNAGVDGSVVSEKVTTT